MSTENIIAVVDRSMRDPVFGQKFKANPDAVLEELEFEFDDDEKELLASRDANEIREEIAEQKAFWGISIAGIVI